MMMTVGKRPNPENQADTPLFMYGDVTPQTDAAFDEQQTPIGSSIAEFHASEADSVFEQRVFRTNTPAQAILKFSEPFQDTPARAKPEIKPTIQPFEDSNE